MRKTIYISERRSKEIADFVKSIPAQDVSHEVVKLMEDGMKWRAMGNDVDKNILETRGKGEVLLHKASLPLVEEKKERPDFSDIRLEKKKLDRGDLEARLNNL